MEVAEKANRLYTLDSLRGFLMLLVVWGHLMEILPGMGAQHPVYKVIYSFHMPAFLFLSGFLGKFRWKTILKTVAVYLVFQVLYQLFDHMILKSAPLEAFRPGFKTSYWLLWYLLVLCYYYLSIALLQRVPKPYQPLALLAAVGAALLVGYIPSIGYPFSLSRAFFFYPYFVAGYYLGQNKTRLLERFRQMPAPGKRLYCIVTALSGVLAAVLCLHFKFSVIMLYGSYPYRPGYTPWTRIQMMGIAALWIHFFFSLALLFPKKRVAVLEAIGRHTLPIYLAHGFVIKWLGQYV